MAKTKTNNTVPLPMFKAAKLMSQITGIGENTIRTLMDKREIEFIQIGNRRLIADSAMWDWYQRNKIPTAI